MENLAKLVSEALDNALDNGYDLSKMTLEQIADDLLEFDADLEGCTAEQLIPHIQAWWSMV